MCGLAGWWCANYNLKEEFKLNVNEALRSLRFRGPDNLQKMICEKNYLGLLHARLSILDIREASNQPFISHNGDWSLVFNGEIYNHIDIRKKYLSNVYFHTNSDTETLVELISKFGFDEAIPKLDGMFAIVAFQESSKILNFARDYFGEKPLFYTYKDEHIVFGSTVESINKLCPWTFEYSREELCSIISYGFNLNTNTIYDEIKILKPGCIASLELGKKLKIKNFTNNNKFDETSFSDILCKSVNSRLISDVPIGCFLSGGYDSSLIAAIVSRKFGRTMQSFTFSSGDEFDEASIAENNAKKLGLDHHIVSINANELQLIVEDMAVVNDQPFCDSSQIPTYLICREASKSLKVLIGGDGADELFFGYNRYQFVKNIGLKSGLNKALIRSLMNIVGDSLDSSLLMKNAIGKFISHDPNFYRKLIKLKRYFTYNENNMDYSGFLNDFRAGISLLPKDIISSIFQKNIPYDNIKDVRNFDLDFYLPGDILTKVDRASMRWGVEARSPFLNANILEYSNMPDVRNKNTLNPKIEIRSLLHEIAPDVVIPQKKQGFTAPAKKWLADELYDWAQDSTRSKSFTELNLINPEILNLMFDEHKSGKKDYTDILWKVCATASWLAVK
jgi:asparagine synthase (glutamine-hydrolysing)